jgi:hypothetical protein
MLRSRITFGQAFGIRVKIGRRKKIPRKNKDSFLNS